jgi:PKHD-type hydroxylase
VFLVIQNILTEAETNAICEVLAKEEAFADGRSTAGFHAKQVKKNEQATGAKSQAIIQKIEHALNQHPVFRAAAMPRNFVRLLLSRYKPGMSYGTHVDDALMDGVRTDLSFTLFLSDPGFYQGGALIIEGNDGEQEYKLPAGSLILYPSTALHRVAEVTSGERLAAAGWVRSLIRDAGQREILFDLDNTIASLRTAQAGRPVLDRLYKVRANLIRMWAQD